MRLIGLLLMLLLIPVASYAQVEPRPAKVDDLVRLLQDPEVRNWIERAPSASPESEVSGIDISRWQQLSRDRIRSVFSAVPSIPSEMAAAAARTRQDAMSNGGAPVFLVLFGLAVLGLVAEFLYRRSRRRSPDLIERLLATGVFSVTMAIGFFVFEWPPLAGNTLFSAIVAIVVYRFLAAGLASANLQPRIQFRIKLFLGVLIVAAAVASLGQPLSIPPQTSAAVSLCFSILLLAIAVEGVLSTSARSLRVRYAVCIALLVGWCLWFVGLKGLFWLLIYALVLPHLLRLVGRSTEGFVDAKPFSAKRILIVRGSRAVVIVLAMAWLALVWRFDPNSLVHIDPAITAVSYGLLKSVIILLLADLAWHLARSWIDRSLSEDPAEAADPMHLARQSRLRTLLPIFRNMLAVVVAVIAGLIVLSELGVEIGPLVAGAGIFGVALGFGSQTLVKDVISGVFYMFDDAFRVGEYIQSKNYKGTVEGFSIRSVRLRHHRGPVFTIPFGELGAVQNMSRDWGVVKFRVSVGFDTDVEKARKLTKKIGAALMEDPELGPLFIEPLKMKGIEEFGDYGLQLSFGMTLRPSPMQSFIRRRANLLLRQAFTDNGIGFATPSVQVGGSEGDKAAAASGVVAQQITKDRLVTDTAAAP
ncbi:mechanosensitive ion channel [Agrobacterium tumefaciens]|uniref:mechanosensitive ion channel family protein n=1 Tax=Agrobacterium tumefaciens TaxID=358 RepID=UPI001572DC15|nr:mechanosensitive ion channel family protein [Agrobacterium tumefaciens]NSX88018.1 mechanosensitive ion channel [Agrobacterium tumefaciens]